MVDGMRWSAYWFVDGELDEAGSYLDESWAGSDTGNWWVCVMDEGGLGDGLYELVLEVEGESLLTDAIFVGGDHSVIDFTLNNESALEVCYIQIAPNQAENWGQDRRAEETLPPTERVFARQRCTHAALGLRRQPARKGHRSHRTTFRFTGQLRSPPRSLGSCG
jgi:hypothetical protein